MSVLIIYLIFYPKPQNVIIVGNANFSNKTNRLKFQWIYIAFLLRSRLRGCGEIYERIDKDLHGYQPFFDTEPSEP